MAQRLPENQRNTITENDRARADGTTVNMDKRAQELLNQYYSTGALGGATIYGTPKEQLGEAAGRANASIYYGNVGQIGADAENYRNRVRSNLDQPSGLANRLAASSNADIARANAKAGLSGVDTTAASIRERRAGTTKAAEIQQSQDQINLQNYGKSIGAGISGTESMGAAGAGKAIAATPTPTPSYGGGMFGSIICSELFDQKKLTLRELAGCNDFRKSIDINTYSGYLFIARPIVVLMRKSDKFSNLFINWSKCISKGRPNLITRIMIPVCFMIGLYGWMTRSKKC